MDIHRHTNLEPRLQLRLCAHQPASAGREHELILFSTATARRGCSPTLAAMWSTLSRSMPGAILIASNTAPQTAYLYGGQQFDTDLNQYYLRPRVFLIRATGRFFTGDKWLATRKTHARFTVTFFRAADDPVGTVDPDGESFVAFDGTGNYPGERMEVSKLTGHSIKCGMVLPIPIGIMKSAWARAYRGCLSPGQAFGAGMARRERQARRELKADRAKGRYGC